MSQLKNKIEHWFKKRSKIKLISDGLFVLAIGVSAYTLISTTLIRSKLPPGVCPIDDRSEFYQLSIGLLILSLVVSLFDKKKVV